MPVKKTTSLLLCSAVVIICNSLFAGDTLRVQTFVNGSNQDSTFIFPPDSFRVEKILMNYKLKCNPLQNPACGEWDYLTYAFLYDNTHVLDSTLYQAPSYVAGGSSPDSLQYNNPPAWNYFPHFQYFNVISTTASFDSAMVPLTGTFSPSNIPFGCSSPQSRTQYIWLASELTSGGISAGNITGLRFNVVSAGSTVHNLTIKLKHTGWNAFSSVNVYDSVSLTTVYHLNTTLVNGWNALQFITPFNWNGSSNILVEISYDNSTSGTNTQISSESISGMTMYSRDGDQSLFCQGNDYVAVPNAAFAAVDSFITISFWQYGNPAFQPQDQINFEGLDAQGRRVVNVHLPWSNSNVYWDAGNSGTGNYDRINKLANLNEFSGKWNHWAFVKNDATGTMKIYLNGSLWHSGTGFSRRMNGITQFKIGSSGNGSGYFYDGNMDEFEVFNAELDSTTIQNWMFKDMDATHPFYTNLRVYYQFNDANFSTVNDNSGNGFHGGYFGTPETPYVNGPTLFRNFIAGTDRPNVIFEKGVYTSYLDSLLVIDSIQKPPVIVVKFEDVVHPTTPTDTVIVWQPYYTYLFNSAGIPYDSTLIGPDTTLHLIWTPYYGPPFEIINRYELGRFITPYGNGLDLGNGFTWVFDVTDYEPLLHDSVHLTAGNWQELLDLSFDFIKGTPPRDVLDVQNIWNGNYGLGNIVAAVAPKIVNLSASASMFRVKARTTGHGFGGGGNTNNCAEFCPKNQYVLVDGTVRNTWNLWNECSLNPVYPQGGTWVYDRSGWCPGMDVKTYDTEITPFVAPGGSPTLDYNSDYDAYGNYVLETQLISYSPANFSLDASLELIKSPGLKDQYKRMNPVCSNPVITIKNTGTTPLTSLKIHYGMIGAPDTIFNWTGNLKFLEETDVTLGKFQSVASGNTFLASVSEPNGGTDQYSKNDSMTSPFLMPPAYPADIVFEFRTGTNYWEDSYIITDMDGNTVFSRTGASGNFTYRDTLSLPSGCYTFKMTDSENDGLSFWNNPGQGSGTMKIKKAQQLGVLKTFNPDFGGEIYHQFMVNYYLNTPEYNAESYVSVFPNPALGRFFIEAEFSTRQPVSIEVFTISGEKVYSKIVNSASAVSEEIILENSSPGIYFVKVVTNEKSFVNKVVMMK